MAWETLFFEGFDHIGSPANKGWVPLDVGPPSVSAVGGGRGGVGRGLFCSSTATQAAKSFSAGANKYFCAGFALKNDAAGTSRIMCMLGTGGKGGQLLLVYSSDSMLLYRGNMGGSGTVTGATLLGTAAGVQLPGPYTYFELECFIDPVNGYAILRADGDEVMNLTSINTQNSTAATRQLTFGGPDSNFDDVYLRTADSIVNPGEGFLGDIFVRPHYPVAEGTYSQMTPSAGLDHFAVVDDPDSINTADYVESATQGQKESYQFQGFTGTGTILGVQVSAYVHKVDSGYRGVDLFCKSGATESFSPSKSVSVSGVAKSQLYVNDPNTAAPWTSANLNVAEFGQRISTE